MTHAIRPITERDRGPEKLNLAPKEGDEQNPIRV